MATKETRGRNRRAAFLVMMNWWCWWGVSVDERDPLGYTPLMLAIRCGNYTEAAALLEQGHASMTLRDDEFHRTAIEWAEQSAPHCQQRTSRSIAIHLPYSPFRNKLNVVGWVNLVSKAVKFFDSDKVTRQARRNSWVREETAERRRSLKTFQFSRRVISFFKHKQLY